MFKLKLINGDLNTPPMIETSLMGADLLNTPKLNKGCAFTQSEREQFELVGLLPNQIETLEQQAARMYGQFNEHHRNLSKNIYLNVLHDYNETLFYKLVSQHLEEMLPIIYTPTVGEAVQRFSSELRKAKGLYLNYNDRDHLDKIIEQQAPLDVDLTVITDGEAVLGIGDQGIGGINISIAKLMVYTLCGGISPHRVLPIQLDVGTNNQHLLNDPMYLGWRHERITGQAYDDFIDAVVVALKKRFPHLLFHWEDIGRDNARRILTRYRDKICTMNGDMQTTGVVALACVLAGVHASGVPLPQHRIVIMGAGTAGIGIAEQIYDAMLRAGLNPKEAREKFWLVDKNGLLTNNVPLLPFQAPFARDENEISTWILKEKNTISLYDVVNNVHPTILIGCSTAADAFNEEMVKLMAAHVSRPIIMPLSNPNSLAEAKPEDLIRWTEARAIIATGSPFADVQFGDKWYRIAQSNNAFAFPGIGAGVIISRAKHITDNMLWAATEALSNCSPIMQDKTAPLLPKLAEAKMVSSNVALAVADAARKEGLATIDDGLDFKTLLKQQFWEPKYYPYRKV